MGSACRNPSFSMALFRVVVGKCVFAMATFRSRLISVEVIGLFSNGESYSEARKLTAEDAESAGFRFLIGIQFGRVSRKL